MSLFGIKVEEESLEKQAEEFLKECEKVMNVAYKASGVGIMDVMDGLDAESGAMLGSAMTLYRKSKNLVLTQAKATDKMQNSFDELKKMNEKLLAQNEELQRMLRELSRKIEK
ncbi:hypothetical protein [Bacteroides sp.]|uniref:hypothetical protein n=1 Tax=Bacteroides sp. TaxID=29523 RepID=UPI002587F6BF|nr:hypothetical protein [Bacteroides sp.]